MVIKAADMMIARRADTRARADFATWKMMAKLNGASALPAEAQTFLAIYRAYYAEMGGAGAPPDVPAHSSRQATGNITAFKRPPAPKAKPTRGPDAKPRLPVALIFACLVVVYVGLRYFWQ